MDTENDTPLADARHTVSILDSTEGGADAMSWANGGTVIDDDTDVSAEMPVTLSGGLWKKRRDDGELVVGQAADKHTMATVRLYGANQSNRWMGLALITVDHRDIRADLLGLVWQRNTCTLPKLIRYGADYLLAAGHGYPDDVRLAAAADALLIVAYGATRGDGRGRKRKDGTYTAGGQVKRHRPRRPTLRRREAQFRLRHDGGYARLRDAAERAYRKRYREAVDRFVKADDWRPTSYGGGGSGREADSLWHPERYRLAPGLLTTGLGHNGRYEDSLRADSIPIARRAA